MKYKVNWKKITINFCKEFINKINEMSVEEFNEYMFGVYVFNEGVNRIKNNLKCKVDRKMTSSIDLQTMSVQEAQEILLDILNERYGYDESRCEQINK